MQDELDGIKLALKVQVLLYLVSPLWFMRFALSLPTSPLHSFWQTKAAKQEHENMRQLLMNQEMESQREKDALVEHLENEVIPHTLY